MRGELDRSSDDKRWAGSEWRGARGVNDKVARGGGARARVGAGAHGGDRLGGTSGVDRPVGWLGWTQRSR
jgi:hypothetical protein